MFDPSTEGTYSKHTQGIYDLSTEKVISKTDGSICTANQTDTSSSDAWPTASIVTTACLGVSAVVGWGLVLLKCVSSSAKITPIQQTVEMSDTINFSRDMKGEHSNLQHHATVTPLQIFIPMLILNLQMQVTSAVQTMEDQVSWLTSLFERKETSLGETPEEDFGGLSYPYQDMCFENQNFDFLPANDTYLSYDYSDFG